MTARHLRRRQLLGCALATALSLGLAGCGESSSPTSLADGYTVTVPVLWAGRNADGTPAGGVEPASVWVGEDNNPGYSVDYTDLEAGGAGAAWRAASGSAAAIGTLFSSANPAQLGIRFNVTGPIDGPSGGAALTVGVIAATRRIPLIAGVTMTGTIAPDGSIGRVTSIPTKLRAAAASGYKTVLLPSANMTDGSDPTVPTSMVQFGQTLGLTVLPVLNRAEAVGHMTGSTLNPLNPNSPRMSATAAAATSTRTTDLIQRLSSLTATANVSADQRRRARLQLSAARQELQADNTPAAYALGLAEYRRLLRESAQRDTAQDIRARGLPDVQQGLVTRANELRALAETQRREAVNAPTFDSYQRLSLPAAIAPLTYAIAVISNVESVISQQPSRRNALATAAALADQRASLDTAEPTSSAVVASSPSTLSAPPGVEAFLSGYTNFLVAAGEANQQYADELLGGRRPEQPTVASLSAVVDVLDTQTSLIPLDSQDLDAELIQSSQAITFFVFSSALVTDQDIFGIREEQLGNQDGLLPDPEPVRQAVRNGEYTVNGLVVELSQRGISAELANWLSQWGTQAAQVTRGTQRETSGSLVGLHQLWGASVNVLLMQAWNADTTESAPETASTSAP